MQRYVFVVLVVVALLAAGAPDRAPSAHATTGQGAYLPLIVTDLSASNNLEVSTATYLGGAGSDAANAIDIAPDGSILLGGRLPGHNPGGVTPISLLGGGDGAIVRFNRTGELVLSITRIGNQVNDLEVNDVGHIAACGDFGIIVLDSQARNQIWPSNSPGAVERCAIGADDVTAALVTGGSPDRVHVYSATGSVIGSWNSGSSGRHYHDVAVAAEHRLVIVTGYDQKDPNLKVPFIEARSYASALDSVVWKAYDFSASAIFGQNLGADSEGQRVAIGRDGKLYLAGTTDGGNTVYTRNPQALTEKLSGSILIKTDKYNDPYGLSGAKKLTWFGRFNPASGQLERAQFLLTRLSSGGGNSIAPKAITADAVGRVYISGDTYASIENRAARQVAGITVGDYESSEPYLLAISADFSQRLIWSPFAAPGMSAGGSPAYGVATRNGVVAVAITLKPKSGTQRGLITYNALQSTPGTLPDAYIAVWPQ